MQQAILLQLLRFSLLTLKYKFSVSHIDLHRYHSKNNKKGFFPINLAGINVGPVRISDGSIFGENSYEILSLRNV